MGAHAAGEKASQIATEKIPMHYFRSTLPRKSEALRTAVMEANSEIHQQGQSNPEFHNMGTTASSLAILPSGAVIAHVGDSRVYRLRNGVLEQLTFDHSLVWEMEASGHGDSKIWGQTIPKNVITRSLGPSSSVEVDVEGPLPIEAGDCFLMCSDGLSGLVNDAEIGTLIDCLPADQAARVLVDLANLRGGPDNITLVIVRARDASAFTPVEATMLDRPKEFPVSTWLVGSAAGCFLSAAVLGGLALGGRTQMVGVMVVMLILGAIATSFAVANYRAWQRKRSRMPSPVIGGGAPYRREDAKPSEELYNLLGRTIQELRDAAKQRRWAMNWNKVDKFQKKGQEALKSKDPKNAIRFQAEAIIETMNQLREQHNRSASETAIEY
jgi:protein phosphatase